MAHFLFYLRQGWQHIVDVEAIDHICFIAVLVVVFRPMQWRNVLVLLTAFTIGHAVSILLTVTKWVKMDAYVIELMIPVTILYLALQTLFRSGRQGNELNNAGTKYFNSMFFGLIHGLGFAGMLNSLLGREASLLVPMLGFNIGLELGQILIAMIVIGVGYAYGKWIQDNRRWFVRAICIISALLAGWLIFKRL